MATFFATGRCCRAAIGRQCPPPRCFADRQVSPDAYCEQKAAASGSSFYHSFRFLPPERRRAIIALYAFCREVDDAVDETIDAAVARIKLECVRSQVAAIFGGAPSTRWLRR